MIMTTGTIMGMNTITGTLMIMATTTVMVRVVISILARGRRERMRLG